MNEELFCYLVDFGDVSANNIYTSEIAFDSDSDFKIRQIRTNLSDTTEGKITIKKGTVDLSNAAFALRAITGTGNGLNLFDEYVIPRGTKWTVSANISDGTSQPLQIQFWGMKIK